MSSPYQPYANVVLVGVVVLGALSGFAFHPGYLAVEKATLPWFVHAHTALMILWMLMLLVQAYFIRKKNLKHHRKVGAASYLLMPALLTMAALMIPYAYHRGIHVYGMTEAQARASTALPSFYFAGLLLFYALGILARRSPVRHGQYMLATALMLTGPILDRVLYIHVPIEGVAWELVAFVIMDLVFVWVLVHSGKVHGSRGPAIAVLLYFLMGQSMVMLGSGTVLWQSLSLLFFS